MVLKITLKFFDNTIKEVRLIQKTNFNTLDAIYNKNIMSKYCPFRNNTYKVVIDSHSFSVVRLIDNIEININERYKS